MPQYFARREMPFSAEDLFDVVADVERYPEFVPGCTACRIREWEDDKTFVAEVAYGLSAISFRYVCRVVLDRPYLINVRATEGTFSHLTNHWKFEPTDKGVLVEYSLDFDFESRFMSRVGEKIMNQAALRMIDAFHRRARILARRAQSGPGASGGPAASIGKARG